MPRQGIDSAGALRRKSSLIERLCGGDLPTTMSGLLRVPLTSSATVYRRLAKGEASVLKHFPEPRQGCFQSLPRAALHSREGNPRFFSHHADADRNSPKLRRIKAKLNGSALALF
jgi:hypothetical protein